MVFYDEAEARKLYERYKLQWLQLTERLVQSGR